MPAVLSAAPAPRSGGKIILKFPEGIYGFEDVRKFILLQEDESRVIWSLQAAERPCPSLIVVDPFLVAPGYSPKVPAGDLRALGEPPASGLCFLAVAVLRRDLAESVVNLKSPIVINPRTRTGRQVILEDSDYPVRYRPFRDARQRG